MSAAEFKNKGNDAFKENRFQEAIDWYSKAIEVAPNDHVLYSNRSGSWASLHKYDEALQDAEKCVQLNPQFVKGYQRKGLALFYLGRHSDAATAYKAGLQLEPNNKGLQDGLQAAESKLMEEENPFSGGGNPFGAGGSSFGDLNNPKIQQLLAILQKDPRTASFAGEKSFQQLISIMLTNPQLATQFLQNDPRVQTALNVILENPEAQQIFFQEVIGKQKGAQGAQQPQGAQQQQQKSHDHHGHDHHDHDNCQDHSNHQQQQQQQQQPKPQPKPEPSKKMEEEKPLDDAEKAKLEGNDFYKKKDFEKALQAYDRAIELKPTEPLYYNNKAAVYIELKQYDQALQVTEQALKVMEDNHSNDFVKKAKLFARKGKVLWLLGDLEGSIKFFEKSLLEDNIAAVRDELKRVQKEKKDKDALSYINPELAEEHNQKGGEEFKAGRFPNAIKEYEEAIRRHPKEAKYYCNKATAYMKLMEFNQALKDLERCLELDSKYVKAYIKKGIYRIHITATCHSYLKEFKKAKDCYELGLKLDPENKEIKEGLTKVQQQIFTSQYTESEEDHKARAQRAMQDPEIQAILREPEVINLLQEMQNNPQTAMQGMMKNKDLASKVEKLIAAGVLKIG